MFFLHCLNVLAFVFCSCYSSANFVTRGLGWLAVVVCCQLATESIRKKKKGQVKDNFESILNVPDTVTVTLQTMFFCSQIVCRASISLWKFHCMHAEIGSLVNNGFLLLPSLCCFIFYSRYEIIIIETKQPQQKTNTCILHTQTVPEFCARQGSVHLTQTRFWPIFSWACNLRFLTCFFTFKKD